MVRERYGKIYLTDSGFLLAKDMLRCIELIHERLPAMGFDLTEEEAQTCSMGNMKPRDRKKITEMDLGLKEYQVI